VNSGNSLYALHVTTTGIDRYCVAGVAGAFGSPIVFGGGATAEVIAVGTSTIFAYSTAMTPGGGACNPDALQAFGVTGARPTLGPPSAHGNTLYFGYNNSANVANDLGVKSIQFISGSFSGSLSQNLGKRPTALATPAAISPAADLFFGIDLDRLVYRYVADLSASPWNAVWTSNPSVGGNTFSQPLVSGSLVFAISDALYTYSVTDGTAVLPTLATGATQVSPPTIATKTIFVSNATNKEVVAFDSTSRTAMWRYVGSASTTPVTTLSSVATEATLGPAPEGILYFADSGGRIYAVISDDTPLAPAAGDWPRTGYDNCNSNHSNNAGFVCQ